MPLRLCVPSFENRKFWFSCPTTSLSCAYKDSFISHPNQNLCFKLPWSTVPLISNVRAFHTEGRFFVFSRTVILKQGALLGGKPLHFWWKIHREESARKPASVTGRLQHKFPKARRCEVKACAPFPCHFFMPGYLLRGLGSARYVTHYLYCHC